MVGDYIENIVCNNIQKSKAWFVTQLLINIVFETLRFELMISFVLLDEQIL